MILILLFACSKNDNLILVNNSQSDYQIIISENASPWEQKAANELKKYIEKSTNVNLTISNTTKNPNKGIYIQIDTIAGKMAESIGFEAKDGNLYIKAGSGQYSLYAVYEFLEQSLGCRFYAPDAEKIPFKAVVEIPANLNYKYSPKIITRTVHSKLFYDNHGFADKQKVTYKAFPYYVEKARVHTFHAFVPAEVYFTEHPEYYALIDGKRRITQLCLSNHEVIEIVKQEVAKYFAEQPQASVISVSQNDNTQYCKCEKCATIDKEEGSSSGSMVRFVNQIAKEFPDKTISTLAYQYTRTACKTKPADNVLITLCSIECDRSAPIEEKCKDFAEDLKQWKELTSNIRIWDYTTQFTNFLAPFPNIYTLKPNIAFFADNNAKWVFEQHSNEPSELFELRSYLTARLLWNPEVATDSIIADFTSGYYHEAGPLVQKYIKLIHENIQKDKDFFLFLYGDPAQAFHSFLNAENLIKYNQFFDDAENEVANKPEILNRVKKARLGVSYATLEACRANISDIYTLKNKDFVGREYEKFVNTCKIAGIEWMNETRFSVEEYQKLYQSNI
ncbi:MAG: DUF4838 domain-containing protein, partial [Bacteroidales bacterium]|nr:DUF4838 domain-containing protein [Bacteroidales bacterium]